MERKEFLVGITNDNEVAFMEVEVRNRNYDEESSLEFSASFNCVMPFIVEDSDGIEYAEHLLNDCYTDKDKYDLCERFNCKLSDLAEALADDMEIRTNADERDCSLYPNRIMVDDTEYAFESMGCGQHDIMKSGLKECVNTQAFMKLYEYWQKYHLKVIDNEQAKEVEDLVNEMLLANEEEEIVNYIKKYKEVL